MPPDQLSAAALGAPEDVGNNARVFTVYQIENSVTGKVYIGHTHNYPKRAYMHRFHLGRGTHHSLKLQRSWRKHGAAAFNFSPLIEAIPTLQEALQTEQRLITAMGSKGYNIAPVAGSTLGTKRAAETLAKMSAWQKGKPKSEEHAAKIAATLTGRSRNSSATEKQAAKLRGKSRPAECVTQYVKTLRAINGTKTYEAFGQVQYLQDWAKEFGMNKATIRNRMVRRGMSLEQALTLKVDRRGNDSATKDGGKVYEAFGRAQPLYSWAQEFSMRPALLRQRMRRDGLTMEQAITKPINKSVKEFAQ